MKYPWYRSLAVQLIAVQTAIVVLALAVFVAVLVGASLRAADLFVRETDVALARRLAPWIERYYAERGSFEGLDRLLRPTMPMAAMMRNTPRGGPAPSHENWRLRLEPRPSPDGGPEPPAITGAVSAVGGPVALFSMDGALITAVGIDPDRVGRPLVPLGLVIVAQERPIGRLYVGSMITAERTPLARGLRANIGYAAMVSAAAVLLFVLLAAVMWTRVIARPLRALASAAERLGTDPFDSAPEAWTAAMAFGGAGEVGVLARAFTTMAERIGAQETARRRFVADAAHELRTPITLLKTQLEMLEAGAYRWDESQLTGLQRSVDRLAVVVGDLQLLARLDAGGQQPNRRPTDVAQLVEETVFSFKPLFAERSMRVVTDATAMPAIISVDPERIGQVISNLLSNALRYAPAGSTVRTAVRRDGDTVLVAVEDEGPGIAPHLRERVFERFFRGPNARAEDIGGSGLGLAICRAIVAQHGGTIVVADHPGGARLEVRLPAMD